jgi:hypothetical protein
MPLVPFGGRCIIHEGQLCLYIPINFMKQELNLASDPHAQQALSSHINFEQLSNKFSWPEYVEFEYPHRFYLWNRCDRRLPSTQNRAIILIRSHFDGIWRLLNSRPFRFFSRGILADLRTRSQLQPHFRPGPPSIPQHQIEHDWKIKLQSSNSKVEAYPASFGSTTSFQLLLRCLISTRP